MNARPRTFAPDVDCSRLPIYGFGTRDPLYLGVLLLVAIETTMFGLLLASFFYVRLRVDVWPTTSLGPDVRALGTAGAAVLLATLVPLHLGNAAAYRGDLRGMRRAQIASTLGLGTVVALRFVEMARLGFRWDSHAYGSLFWAALVAHTGHALTSVLENLVLVVVLFRGPVEKKLLVDVEVNGIYGYFVVASWIPFYVVLYLEHVVFG